MYLGNVVGLIIVLTCVPLFAAILRIPFTIIAPVILVICAIGAYTVNNAMFDVWLMLVFGVVGYVFNKLDYPLPPLVLALVLGDMAEEALPPGHAARRRAVSAIFWSNWLVGVDHDARHVLLLFWPLISALDSKTAGRAPRHRPDLGARRLRAARDDRAYRPRTARRLQNNRSEQRGGNGNEGGSTTPMLRGWHRRRSPVRSRCRSGRIAQAWEPTKPVTFIIPAGTGGGADQMARFIQGVVTKHNLMKQPIVVVNKAGGAGAEGFLEVKGSKGDPHKIIITLSNLFTTPLATGMPFNWKDLTPVAMLALDQFVLWVNARRPTRPPRTTSTRSRPAPTASSRWAAPAPSRKTRSSRSRSSADRRQEVHLRAVRAAARSRCSSSASTSNSTVNNPIEAVAQWQGRHAAPALHLRRQAQHLHQQGDGRHGVDRHPDLQGVGRRRRVPDAARHLHAGGRDAGAGRVLRRPVQEGDGDAGLEEVHGGRRLQPDVHDRATSSRSGSRPPRSSTTT